MAPAAPFFLNVNLIPLALDLTDEKAVDDYIDYTDLEEKFSVPDKFSCILVVDGLPIIEETKREKFITYLIRFFAKEGFTLSEEQVHLPFTECADGVSRSDGFLFLCCDTPKIAEEIKCKMQNASLDKSTALVINKFMDIKHYASVPTEWNELKALGPEPEFVPRPFLDEWIANPEARDQIAISLHTGSNKYSVSTGWFKAGGELAQIASREDGAEGKFGWSPHGSYLAAKRRQGIRLLGGSTLDRMLAFEHPGVQHFAFSPRETYLVTYSPEPLPPASAKKPWGRKSVGHNIVIWHVAAERILRSFPVDRNDKFARSSNDNEFRWPYFKWSWDEKYLASTDSVTGQLSVYESSNMTQVDRAFFCGILNVTEFEWMPYSPPESQPLTASSVSTPIPTPTTSLLSLSSSSSSSSSSASLSASGALANTKKSKKGLNVLTNGTPVAAAAGGKSDKKTKTGTLRPQNIKGDMKKPQASSTSSSSAAATPGFMPPVYSLAYFSPSQGSDKPAHLALLNVAKREYVRRLQIFHAPRGEIQFSKSGEFLVFRVLRTNKSGKTFYTTVEILRLREKDFPCDSVEIRAPVCTLELAPAGNHFAVIAWDNPNGTGLESKISDAETLKEGFLGKMVLTFYVVEPPVATRVPVAMSKKRAAAAAAAAAATAAATAAAAAAAKAAAKAAAAAAEAKAAAATEPSRFTTRFSTAGPSVAPILAKEKNVPIGTCVSGNVKVLASFDYRSVNRVYWSPKGRFALAAGEGHLAGRLEFYDVDPSGLIGLAQPQAGQLQPAGQASQSVQTTEEGRQVTVTKTGERVHMLAANEHHGVASVEWDPTGRYVTSVAPATGTKNSEGKYIIWSFSGAILNREAPGMLAQVLWRPRPPTLLPQSRVQKITRNIRNYIRDVEAKDFEVNEAATLGDRERRQRRFHEFMYMRSLALMRVQGELVSETYLTL